MLCMKRQVLKSFNTQPPEGGCVDLYQIEPVYKVSTHSRPKAAAARTTPSTPSPPGFNTQPPEGGCKVGITALPGLFCFNTQPPEGGCLMEALIFLDNEVSTHSRPKAAALIYTDESLDSLVYTKYPP